MSIFELAAIAWAITAPINYGLVFSHLQAEWPDFAGEDIAIDRLISLVYAVLGPIGSVVLAKEGMYRNGFRYW